MGLHGALLLGTLTAVLLALALGRGCHKERHCDCDCSESSESSESCDCEPEKECEEGLSTTPVSSSSPTTPTVCVPPAGDWIDFYIEDSSVYGDIQLAYNISIGQCECTPSANVKDSAILKFSMQNRPLTSSRAITLNCTDMSKFCALAWNGEYIKAPVNATTGEFIKKALFFPACEKIGNNSHYSSKGGKQVCATFLTFQQIRNRTLEELEMMVATTTATCFGCKNLPKNPNCYGPFVNMTLFGQ